MKITWSTRDGREVKVEIEQHGAEVVATAFVGGKYVFCGTPELMEMPISGAVARLGNLGLVQERYDEVMAAIRALRAELDEIPEVKFDKLARQRERLAETLNWARDDAYQAEHDRIEHTRVTGIGTAAVNHSSKVHEAEAALAAFDAAHPEIVAELKADRAKRTAAHMWD